MEQDFYRDFKGWVFNPKTCEAVIMLFDGKTWRYIHVLDPMWLVNCSKKDIECLFFNKIMYYEANKEQALRYQKLVKRHNERMEKKMAEATKRARWRLELGSFETNQTPIESEERKIPRWSKSMDGIKEKYEWWINEGRHERKRMLAERAEERERKRKYRERRRNMKE
ncbi:hypothetical protein Hanom_Chr02g00131731 [Helianthus anomalus]